MVFSTLTTATSGNGGQYNSREGVRPDTFQIHHAATANRGVVLGMMSSGSRQVSANYVIDGDQIIGVVPEEFRAWTSGSGTWDRRSITVEVVNSEAGDASGWPISEASYRSLIRLAIDLNRRYGVPLDRNGILGHRELWTRYGASYSTACPGGIDLDRIARDAASGAVSPSNGLTQTLAYIALGAL